MPKKTDLSGFSNLAAESDAKSDRHPVALKQLLTPAFIRVYTKFQNVEEMFAQSGVTLQDFDGVHNEKLSKFIAAETEFDGWPEMLARAVAIYHSDEGGHALPESDS